MFRRPDDAVVMPSFGRAAPAALLTADLITPPAPPTRSFERVLRDLTPDLSEDIGSRRWFRGFATLLALAAAGLAFWPGVTPLAAAAPGSLDTHGQDELRSQMIAPLAMGGDSGRHMAATAKVRALDAAPDRSELAVATRIAPGEGLADAMRRAGVAGSDASRALALIAGAVDAHGLAQSTQLDITLGRRTAPGLPRTLKTLRLRAGFDLALTVARPAEGAPLALTRSTIHTDDTPLRIRGAVGPSLYRSARAAGAPANAVQAYLQVLGQQVDLENGLLPTDTFDIVIQHRRAATGERQTGQLLYAGIDRDERPRVQLMRWGSRFYEASGVGEQRSGLVAPVPGRLTSHFGRRRHPVLGFVRMHAGLDFAARHGTPIVAVTDGRVTASGRMGGCGNAVRIDHGGALQTRYCHMSRIAAHAGQAVRRGEVIGYVGSTGLSTGPHLHYEMYRGGRPVNPADVSFVTRAELAGGDLARFRQSLAVLKTVTPGAALAELAASTGAAATLARREIERIGQLQPAR